MVAVQNMVMQVTLLHLENCPHHGTTRTRLIEALAACGLPDAPLHEKQVTEVEAAAQPDFAGSPTILVDGTDLFPHVTVGGSACRLYRTPAGLQGTPALQDLIHALTERINHPSDQHPGR